MTLLRLTSRALRPAAAHARPVLRGVRALATTPSTDDAAKPAAQDAATPASAAPPAPAAAATPKIAKPDEEPDVDDDKPLISPVKRVLYSGLFLAAIGVTGTIYHAAHDDTFRGSLKQSVPFLPWDWLAYETQVVESTVSHMVEEAEHVVEHMVEEAEHMVEHMVEEAEHIVEEVEHMAEDVVKEAKKEMWHVAEESVSPSPSPKPAKRSSSRAPKPAPVPAAAEAIAAPAPTPAVAVVPVVAVSAAAPAPRSLSAEIDAAVARAETDTPAAPADPAKRPLGRSKAIDSLQHSLNRLNAIFSALAQTAPEQAAEFAASLEKHEAHLRTQFAAREAALVDEANRSNGDSLLAIPQARATDVPPVGFVSYSLSRALSALLIPKAPGLYKENDMESVLARVEYHLQREDLDAATRELNALTGWPKRLVQGWLKEARRYLEVKMAMDVLQTQVGLQSLGAV
ncbi:hypothetical protein AMAG_03470 [Allomyces macrogynus ATCC 38327]|uniref:MICOS complex subunit MIC60 n=1 Tax=Allomyces macrogynus (strain ATCC 38327) TaxID=578462 RepID=A0A0L0S9R9_ALLM3|nr:hypothetical protein AMAG_03470 [Allomyces macrogynus ATCC 38327]|eukprot:KNE59134.1 hypothetical protein AMAG_03470 [Allomyces macrogynus ATCC 38327]